MRCVRCGCEFSGNFCNNCGMPINQVVQPTPAPMPKKKSKGCLPVILVVVAVVALIAYFNKDGKMDEPKSGGSIQSEVTRLGLEDYVPRYPDGEVKVDTNTKEELYVIVKDVNEKAFKDYVQACREMGYTVDEDYDVDYFCAYNAEGFELNIDYYSSYERMDIELYRPEEEEPVEEPQTQPVEQVETTPATQATEAPATTEATEAVAVDVIDPEFKAAMDSYEAFMDEYVAFMKKYKANPNDMSLLLDLATYMEKYEKFCKDFEKWEDEDMNMLETAYYLEVQARVSQKLLEVAY